MRKPLIQILAFLLTLFIGVVIYWALFVPSNSVQKTVPLTTETFPESKTTEINNEPVELWVFKIKPCLNKNSLSYSSPDWRGKGYINGGVVNRRALCGTLPEYPQEAKTKTISGVVTINVSIDEIGEVKKATPESGHPLLLKSAIKAAYQTRFVPTLLGGASYKVRGILMYKFDDEKGTWLQDPSAPDNPFKSSSK